MVHGEQGANSKSSTVPNCFVTGLDPGVGPGVEGPFLFPSYILQMKMQFDNAYLAICLFSTS